MDNDSTQEIEQENEQNNTVSNTTHESFQIENSQEKIKFIIPVQEKLIQRLDKIAAHEHEIKDFSIAGKLTRIVGLKLEAKGFSVPLGSTCAISSVEQGTIEAEVVGFSGDTLFLMSTDNTQGVLPGAKIRPLKAAAKAPVGYGLLGRILDGRGKPIDDQGPLLSSTFYPLHPASLNPLKRYPISEPLDVGIRAINSLLTIGKGQRIGLFAGSGVGKSVLLSMMTRYTKADIVVVGLIGERGREVKEFIDHNLGVEGLKRSIVVATPADTSPLMRINGAWLATSIAEYFRDQGKDVLLLIDSLTRFAQAQRQLGLAIGEPPTTKGYPPSTFARLLDIVERAGNGTTQAGSITAFYTVLVEGDDNLDPIADSARSILDGHIVLSRKLAESGHYPAIDVEASISRVMPLIVAPELQKKAQYFKQIYAHFQENRDLINIGAYQPGSDPLLDLGIKLFPAMKNFLQQEMHEAEEIIPSQEKLNALLGEN